MPSRRSRAALRPLLLLLVLASPRAGAASDAPPPDGPPGSAAPPRSAVLVNPLGPGVALVGSLAARARIDAGGLPLPVGLLDLNLRGHHAVTPRLGISAQLDYTRLDFVLQTRHLAARFGPRLSPGEGGLEAWALTPFALVGGSTVGAGDLQLARWATLGIGVEAGRVWTRGPLAVELGLGAYTSANLAYRSDHEGVVGAEPPRGAPVKPVVNLGIGHAF